MSDNPHLITRKFQNYQRWAAKGFQCPDCSEPFQVESKLWEHAKNLHLDNLGIPNSGDETDVRKQFRLAAQDKAHKNPLRGNQDAEPMNSKPSSNDNDSMRPNVGEDRPSLSPSRHLAASKDPEKNIDDIENLSLSQNRIEDPAADAQSPPRSFNPLKRGAGGESDQPEPPADHSPGRRFSTNRRNKAIPGGSSTGKEKDKDPDFNRSDSRASESRNPTGSTVKRLFDPSTGSPSTSSAYRGGKEEPSIQARRLYDARPHVLRSRKAPTGDKGDASTKSITNLDNNYGGQQFKKVENFTSLPVKLGNGSHSVKNDQINPAMENDEESEPIILLQPETRPISHDQLVVEVKGIYAGLVMVEAKCIDVDEKQSHAAQEKDPSRQSKLSDEQWQALIALHKTLLHEHHDFFLASQHPSASPALSRLAAKYSMPARMWRHGIHAFLEVLRRRLPQSLDHMLAFIYIAYSMMALLYETVSTFEDTWIECLGDLGRYRMAIENDNIRDREIWSNVARFWYCKAADKSPEVGRLYHHLAILARPYTLLQLSHYTRSLTCVIPFDNARDSIMTLFTPILNGKESAYHRSSSLETIFIKAHGLLFSARPFEEFDATVRQITDGVLDSYIGRVTAKFKEQGVFAAVANIAALFEYGSLRQPGVARSIFRLAFDEVRMLKIQESKSVAHQLSENLFDVNDAITRSSSANSTQLNLEKLTSSEVQSSVNHISHASNLAFGTLLICLQRIGDKNVFPLVHVYFVFLMSLAAVEKAMVYVEKGIPWREICSFLNSLANPEALTSRVVGEAFPKPDDGVGRPLPEDFIMRGQMYTQWYFPETWFKDAIIDDEERSLELPSMAAIRVERILWLGFHIASFAKWIKYDEESRLFIVAEYAAQFVDTSVQENELDRAPASEDHDSIMSDVDTSDASDDQINSSRATPELPMSTQSSTTNPNSKPAKMESHENSKPDIEMTDVAIEKSQHKSPTVNKDPAMETASETYLKSGLVQSTPPRQPSKSYLASDPNKLQVINTFDSRKVKEPTEA